MPGPGVLQEDILYQGGPPRHTSQTGGPGNVPVPASQNPGAPAMSPTLSGRPAKVRGSKLRERGEVGGVQVGADGQEYVRDGGWFVLKSVVDQYGGSPDDVPVDILKKNRMPYSKFVTQLRKKNVNASNDEQWNGQAQAAGFNDWRHMQREMQKTPEFQNASDDDKFWLLHGGPNIWNEYGGMGGQSPAEPVDPNIRPPVVDPNVKPKPPGPGGPGQAA